MVRIEQRETDGQTAQVLQLEPMFWGNRDEWFYPQFSADMAFRCTGDCMEPIFYDGDYVIVHQQQSFTDGQIVAVCIGSQMMLKRLYKIRDGFLFIPENRRYRTFHITGKQAEDVKIVGIAIGRKGRSNQ